MRIFKIAKDRFLIPLLMVAGIMTMTPVVVFSQGMNFIGENTDLWRVRGNATHPLPPATGGAWRTDSLWMGPTFLRDTTKKFVVWFAPYFRTQATYKGKLYIMVPRPGLLDTAIFLFRNRCNAVSGNDSTVDLSTIPLVNANIHHLDTVYFMYRSDSGTSGPTDCSAGWALGMDFGVKQTDSLFTGENRAPGEGWIDIDRHYSLRNLSALLTNPLAQNPNLVVDTFFSLNKNKYVEFGRRWSVAGWIHQDTIPNAGSSKRTDTVEFGFEDQYNGFAGAGGGMLYNDIRFLLTGVIINFPIRYDSLVLRMTPNVDTIQAGDSIQFYRSVLYWTDSNQVAHVDSTNLVNGVTWRLAKSSQSGSYMRITTASATNTFKAISAYETDTVIATLFNKQRRKIVYVKPAPDARVWIEPDTLIDTKNVTPTMLSRLQTPDSVVSVHFLTTDNQKIVYGVVRDAYGNFTRFAANSQWTEVPVTTSMVAAANGTPPYVGVINRVSLAAGTTSVKVTAKSLQSGADLVPDQVQVILDAAPLKNLINDTTLYVNERVPAGTVVGTIQLAVPASVNATVTQLATVPEFVFDPSTKTVTVAQGAVLYYNVKNTYSFTVVAKAPNAFNDTATITIKLLEVKPISNLINDTTFYVKEKSPGGTVAGTVNLAVPNSIQVTLTQAAKVPEFSFDSISHVVTVAPGAVLNWDVKNSYTIRIAAMATNAYALNDTATITIQIVADSLIPATATLLDTNHDGHIDKIDITWTDSAGMKAILPSVADFVHSASMITLTGQNDALHPISLASDPAARTIHVILQQNSGPALETGWKSAQVVLGTTPVFVKGAYLQVTQVIDGADPIITAACFSPGSPSDTLEVTFSEPLASGSIAGYLQTVTVNTSTGPATLSVLVASQVSTATDQITYAIPSGKVVPYDNSVFLTFATPPSSPVEAINYCHPLPLVVSAKAGPNPFIPNVSVPPGRHGNDPAFGIRIEILLNSSTSGASGDNRPATCTIFDAVGNVIRKDVALNPDPASPRKRYVVWDGKNKSGMTVAGGTYLARINVEDKTSGSKITKDIKIGVARSN